MMPSINVRFWGAASLPVLLQTEAAECGLACLAMISSYWGKRTDVATVRHRFNMSIKGTSLKGLIDIAGHMGLQLRPLKPSLDQLRLMKLPCVLHWGLNHFVVLKAIGRNKITIHDPAIGERTVTIGVASNYYTGVALELVPNSKFQKGREIQSFTMRGLMGKVTKLYQSLGWLLLMALALEVFALTTPFFMQWLIDDALVSADRSLVSVLCISFLMLTVVQLALSAARQWFTLSFSTHLNYQWLGNAFAHLVRLPPTFFEKRHLGDIVSRFGSITSIQKGLTTQVVDAIMDALLVIGTLGMMFLYSPKLALFSLIGAALYTLLRAGLLKPTREASSEQIIHTARQQTYFMESVRGIQSIKLNGREDERRIGWMNAQADQTNAEIRVAKFGLSASTMNTLIFSVERIAILWLASLMVLDNQFSVGMLMAFLSYKDQFSSRTASLVDKIFGFNMLKLQGARVADILLSAQEASVDADVDTSAVLPSVEFQNVRFRYSSSEPWVLDGVSFVIEPGQFVAITGASGCGKTTIIKLMLGLLNPTEGEILIGGRKITHLGLKALREMVGCVMQDDHLFSGSIAENIDFFDPTPSRERCAFSAQLASIHSEIEAMPMGYRTLVGDLGTGLSGGQKQRLLLARALYREPKIMVLDEATSNLDVQNEQTVNRAIKGIQLTRIAVAHRPETINMAERVIVIHGGKIARDLSTQKRLTTVDA